MNYIQTKRKNLEECVHNVFEKDSKCADNKLWQICKKFVDDEFNKMSLYIFLCEIMNLNFKNKNIAFRYCFPDLMFLKKSINRCFPILNRFKLKKSIDNVFYFVIYELEHLECCQKSNKIIEGINNHIGFITIMKFNNYFEKHNGIFHENRFNNFYKKFKTLNKRYLNNSNKSKNKNHHYQRLDNEDETIHTNQNFLEHNEYYDKILCELFHYDQETYYEICGSKFECCSESNNNSLINE